MGTDNGIHTEDPAVEGQRPSSAMASFGGESSTSTDEGSSSMDEEDRTEPRWDLEARNVSTPLKCDASVQSSRDDVDASMQSSTDSDAEVSIWKDKYENLNFSMDKLTQKFLGAMRTNAELEDKAARLEHTVAQLEGETETIGDYISLYHAQRSAMKTRTEEKDAQIVALVREKQFMQERVAELQNLLQAEQQSADRSQRMSASTEPEIIIEEHIINGDQSQRPIDVPVNPDPNSITNGMHEGYSTSQVASDLTEFMNGLNSIVAQNGGLEPIKDGPHDTVEDESQPEADRGLDHDPRLPSSPGRLVKDPASPGRHNSPAPRGQANPVLPTPDLQAYSVEPTRSNKKENQLARIRQILSEMAETAGQEGDLFANHEFYPCKGLPSRLMNI